MPYNPMPPRGGLPGLQSMQAPSMPGPEPIKIAPPISPLDNPEFYDAPQQTPAQRIQALRERRNQEMAARQARSDAPLGGDGLPVDSGLLLQKHGQTLSPFRR